MTPRLRHRVTVESFAIVRNTEGDRSQVWIPLLINEPAEVLTGAGKEQVAAGQREGGQRRDGDDHVHHPEIEEQGHHLDIQVVLHQLPALEREDQGEDDDQQIGENRQRPLKARAGTIRYE